MPFRSLNPVCFQDHFSCRRASVSTGACRCGHGRSRRSSSSQTSNRAPADIGGRSIFISDNYIIEIRSKSFGITVEAGVVVRDGDRFRFYAATHAFNSLEGQLFESPKAAALCHIVERSTRTRFDGIDVPDGRESNAISRYMRIKRIPHAAAVFPELLRRGDRVMSPNAASSRPRRVRRTAWSKSVIRRTGQDDNDSFHLSADAGRSQALIAESSIPSLTIVPLSVDSIGEGGKVKWRRISGPATSAMARSADWRNQVIAASRHFRTLYDCRPSEGEQKVQADRRRYSGSLPAPEKEFSKTVLTGEQTVEDRELGGKMLPNLRNKAFPSCGHVDGGYV
jgi:hypothetical protein